MTVAATISRDSVSSRVTTKENLVTLIGGIWLTAGLFIDGYAHSNIIKDGEDFFTPWHGFFYSGFTFTAAWIGWLMWQRRQPGSLRDWIPGGYGPSVVGLGIFTAGGLGDMVWHTIFGVETSLDALLSPTHILLLLGLILVLAAPLQSVISGGGRAWVAVTSLATLTALLSFFTTYAHPISSGWVLGVRYDDNNDVWHALAIAGALVTTAILTYPILYVRRNLTDPPFGAVSLIWTVSVVLEAIALSSYPVTAGAAALLGGLTADILFRTIRSGPTRYRYMIALSTGIAVMWTAWTLLTHLLVNAVEWPPELWTGLILISTLAAAGLTLIALESPRDVSDSK